MSIESCQWISLRTLRKLGGKIVENLAEFEDEYVVLTFRQKPIAAIISFERLDRLVAAEEILQKHTEIELEDL